MSKNWGESFGDAFTQSLDTGMRMNFERWKQEQESIKQKQLIEQQVIENQISLIKANLIPDPNGDIMVGGQTYSRRPPIMPNFNEMDIGNNTGIGVTGGTYNPETGDYSLNFGQTPQDKLQQETTQKTNKLIQDEEVKYQSGKTLLEEIKKQWLKTTPPKVTGSGIVDSTKGLLRGATLPAYGVGQWLGSKFQITKNQRNDNAYIRFVNSLRSRLAKGTIGTDVGNLSEYEQRIVTEGVPSGIFDSYETGVQVMENLESMLLKMKEARTEGYKSLDEKIKKEGLSLTPDFAKVYLNKANGDNKKARELAKQDGWSF